MAEDLPDGHRHGPERAGLGLHQPRESRDGQLARLEAGPAQGLLDAAPVSLLGSVMRVDACVIVLDRILRISGGRV